MDIRIPREQEIIQEAWSVLEQNLELSKVALLLSQWQSGHSDYLVIRENLFQGETVQSLGEQILAFETGRSPQDSV